MKIVLSEKELVQLVKEHIRKTNLAKEEIIVTFCAQRVGFVNRMNLTAEVEIK